MSNDPPNQGGQYGPYPGGGPQDGNPFGQPGHDQQQQPYGNQQGYGYQQQGQQPYGDPYQQQNPYGYGTGYAPRAMSPSDERLFAMLAHLLAIFTGFIGPLVIWLIKKDESAFVDDQGCEALNFQITVFIASMVCVLLACVYIGFLLIPVVALGALIFEIIAAIEANKGVAYRYPLNIRFVTPSRPLGGYYQDPNAQGYYQQSYDQQTYNPQDYDQQNRGGY